MNLSDHGDQISYFLGVEGEQLGPFSKSQICEKIQGGEISSKSLIWWEGQADWREIASIQPFSELFNQRSTPTSSPPALQKEKASPKKEAQSPRESWIASYLAPGKELNPVYSAEESSFSAPMVVSSRLITLVISFVVLGFISWGVLKFATPSKTPVVKPKVSSKEQTRLRRKKLLADASSSMVLNPQSAVTNLNELVNQDLSDDVGQEAAQLLLTHFRQNKMYSQAGELLSKMGKNGEAAKTFLLDPNAADRAEAAFFKAFQSSTGKESSDFLMQDITLLLGPLNNRTLAKTRIELFEKTFPGLIHPFSYYLLTSDKKIKDLFSRFSFHFVDTLIAHISEEFPRLSLVGRPIVEVKRDASGKLRFIGRYKGDLALSRDKISDIYFVYWLIDNQWILVDTNLTTDRQIFAATTRKKYESFSYSESQLLEYLEKEFHRLYPNQGLHESPVRGQSVEKPSP